MDCFIAEHLRGVSRTYALLIPMLPEALSAPVGLAYLLMRIIDTLEDDQQIDDQRRAALLASFDNYLQQAGDGSNALKPDSLTELPDWRRLGDNTAEQHLMAESAEVLRRIAALPTAHSTAVYHCARQMISGVQSMLIRSQTSDQPYPAVRTSDDLREYCYYVAGVVGEMLCALMADYLRMPSLLHLRGLAVELGIGLQLVNILKDALKDAKQGRRYLPTSPEGDIGVAEIYRMVVQEARKSLQSGVEFVLALPAAARELRFFCGLPIAWGAMTLARAERDASQGKIGRGAIRSSIELFGRLAASDQALRTWFGKMLAPAPRPA